MSRRRMTREQELRAGIRQARIPATDHRLYTVLLDRIQWGTGIIDDRWQPHSLAVIANAANLSKATTCRGLDRLERHGWITRSRGKGGRGKRTHYPGGDQVSPKGAMGW
jgi:hypothetical protein